MRDVIRKSLVHQSHHIFNLYNKPIQAIPKITTTILLQNIFMCLTLDTSSTFFYYPFFQTNLQITSFYLCRLVHPHIQILDPPNSLV